MGADGDSRRLSRSSGAGCFGRFQKIFQTPSYSSRCIEPRSGGLHDERYLNDQRVELSWNLFQSLRQKKQVQNEGSGARAYHAFSYPLDISRPKGKVSILC